MIKYDIRVYWNGKAQPSFLEGVDNYFMEKGIWLFVRWNEKGKAAFMNVSTAREINIEEVDDGDEYYDLLEQIVGNEQEGDNVE